jgi:penicillin-binding protein 2
MVTATAALQTGKISPGTKIEDVGVIKLGDIEFKNWYFNQYGRKEGFLDIVGAIKRSNDTFFFRVAQRIGEDTLISFSKDFGLGKKSGIEIPGEVSGLVPDGVWKQKTIGEVWYPGDTLNMSIGQGYLLTTPIQIASVTATVASGGKVIQPTIFKTETPKVVNSNIAQKDYINLIKEGMRQAVEPGGTAFPFFGFKIPTGGKTGTAEVGENIEPHAWFTAFAPYDDPEIVVTVVLENAGEGSREAAPVVKEILSWYFGSR